MREHFGESLLELVGETHLFVSPLRDPALFCAHPALPIAELLYSVALRLVWVLADDLRRTTHDDV